MCLNLLFFTTHTYILHNALEDHALEDQGRRALRLTQPAYKGGDLRQCLLIIIPQSPLYTAHEEHFGLQDKPCTHFLMHLSLLGVYGISFVYVIVMFTSFFFFFCIEAGLYCDLPKNAQNSRS